METFGGAVHRCCQSGWASTDDGEIVETRFSASAQTDLLRNVCRCTIEQSHSVGKQDHGQFASVRAKRFHELLRFRIVGSVLDIDPLIWDVAPCQKIPQFIAARRPARAQDSYSLKCRPV
jgi:hypothetical protein